MREIAFPQLLLINVVVDVNGLVSRIASKFPDEFALRPRMHEERYEKVLAATRAEVIIYFSRLESRNPTRSGCLGHCIRAHHFE